MGPFEHYSPAKGMPWCDTVETSCNQGQGWDLCSSLPNETPHQTPHSVPMSAPAPPGTIYAQNPHSFPVAPPLSHTGPNSANPAMSMANKISEVDAGTFVACGSTKGTFIIEVDDAASPLATQRFLRLVRERFFDSTPLYRVVKGFVAQFGLPKDIKAAQRSFPPMKDDPNVGIPFTRGTISFAGSGIDSRTTQVFISFGLTSRTSLLFDIAAVSRQF